MYYALKNLHHYYINKFKHKGSLMKNLKRVYHVQAALAGAFVIMDVTKTFHLQFLIALLKRIVLILVAI